MAMSCSKRGRDQEMAMKEEEELKRRKGGRSNGVEEGEEEVEEESGAVRWESFLPRASLRVLVVDGDDSTRQIIGALLRKCSYRVVSVSDSMKAWEILMEKPDSIDLVLTEVDLPSVSGFSLLNMIMDHEACRNIPVIMTSSHDSISTVFKCMLKGAADFLVKPIRKNELRNLWQHVWRKHSLSGGHGGKHIRQEDKIAKQKLEANPEKENHLHGGVSSMRNNMECSDKGSDAQSSCTGSQTEAESTYKRNIMEHNHSICGHSSLLNDTADHNGEHQIQLDQALQMHKSEDEGKLHMATAEAKPIARGNKQILEDDHSCDPETISEDTKTKESVDDYNITKEIRQNCDRAKPSKEAIDLNGVIDNQPQSPVESSALQNSPSSTQETVSYEKDAECPSTFMPSLELSLRRHQQSTCNNQENDEWNTIKHSGSSAFSLYNSRTRVPTLMTPMNFQKQHEEYSGASAEAVPSQGFGSASIDPQLNGFQARNMNVVETKSGDPEIPRIDGMAIKCSPLRVIPLHFPTGGISFDGMQSMFYPQSATYPLWRTTPSVLQESVHANSSHQSENKEDSFQSHQQDDQSSKSPQVVYPEQRQQVDMKTGDDQRPVPSLADSGSSSICNGRPSQLGSSGCQTVCHGSNMNTTGSNISKSTAEGLFLSEDKNLMEFHRLNQREAALNKFRMKRKDRCFEKKVRYQSRKRLAEQRPRVKGQFVRQVQPDLCSVEASS